jgi:hypothetical protein
VAAGATVATVAVAAGRVAATLGMPAAVEEAGASPAGATLGATLGVGRASGLGRMAAVGSGAGVALGTVVA